MKYLISIVFFLILSLSNTAFAWFFWSHTTVNNIREFNKINGVRTLYVQQPYYINPFSNSRIVLNRSNNFIVDGRTFNRNHPLWRYRIGNAPNQRVLSTRRDQKVYRYDTTNPFCGSVTLYSGGNAFNPSNWTNRDVTATIACGDTLSGCQNQNQAGLVMSHGDTRTPNTTFDDRAGNRTTCSSVLSWERSVLIDKRLPIITSMDFWGVALSEQSEFEAENTRFNFSMTDAITTNYGVSWIKSYDFSVIFLNDHAGNSQNREVCNQSQVYNSYNPIWAINIDDIKHDSIDCSNMYTAWDYRVDLIVQDDAGNIITRQYPLTIYPNDESISRTISLVSPTAQSLYANNIDSYVYRVALQGAYGNPIFNRSILSVNQEWLQNDFRTIVSNMVNQTWQDALWEAFQATTNNNGEFDIAVRSVAPGEFSESFFVTLSWWDSSYENNGITHEVYANTYSTNTFRKPFIWNLSINDTALILSKNQQTYLNITQQSCGSCGNYTISEFQNTFDTTGNGFVVENSENEQNLNNGDPQLDFVLNHDGEDTMDIDTLGIQVSPHISYTLDGQNISYLLTETDHAWDINPIGYDGWVFYGLHIIGNLQWQWKQTVTGQEENFSDITKIEIRRQIQQNASILTSGLTNGQTLDGVKYIVWDYTISSSALGYETLIVEWNLNIDTNITNAMWIIVLGGDITIQNNVTDISAMIYSDGAILSNGTSETQLRIIGNIFTRNTIGGALGDGTNYLLPGWEITNDYDLARSYDLNFLRIWNAGWDINSNNNEDDGEYENASTLVIYDPQNQINPPKGFGVD